MTRSLVCLSAFFFIVAMNLGCAANRVKDDRPLPVDDPDAYGIVYLVKAPATDLREASIEPLRGRFGQSLITTGTTGYGTPYWHISTDYRQYKLDGKRYRSRCSVHCFSYREFPQYVQLQVSCELETHDLRCDFHGLPSWGWHRERREGLHLAHEVIDDIVRLAAIAEDHLIRLRRDPSYQAAIKLIETRECVDPRPAAQFNQTTGN